MRNYRLLKHLWRLWARESQLPPEGDWSIWLMLGGRGAGKTRAGAEWVRHLVEKRGVKRIALVGPTLHDVREVMIEGPSGLKAIAPEGRRPVYNVTRRRLVWPGGAEAHVFSAEDPDSLRGPQFEAAWCDEIGAWAKDEATWDTMMFGLRLGERPRVVATTTPRATKLVKLLVAMGERASLPSSPEPGRSCGSGDGHEPETGGGSASPSTDGADLHPIPTAEPSTRVAPPPFGGDERRGNRVVLTRSATRDNAANLAPGWVAEMEEAYRGSRHERQELDGELVEDLDGAIFSRATIEAGRVRPEDIGEFERVVVAVDPPAGAGENAAACGIVCVGLKADVAYVLEDASVRGLRPLEWARRVAAVARRRGAGRIIAESNQGGEMVREMLRMAGAEEISRVRLRNATASKRDRAEPVSGWYDTGRVRHAGVFRELEDELCSFGAAGGGAASPDRVDALVWAARELLDKPKARPGIMTL
ncbi:MAG TPA: terminase family protein [Hyphomonadaceae bacterium]|nr:terminase family protein [Hyphomonadaceae bacterium]